MNITREFLSHRLSQIQQKQESVDLMRKLARVQLINYIEKNPKLQDRINILAFVRSNQINDSVNIIKKKIELAKSREY